MARAEGNLFKTPTTWYMVYITGIVLPLLGCLALNCSLHHGMLGGCWNGCLESCFEMTTWIRPGLGRVVEGDHWPPRETGHAQRCSRFSWSFSCDYQPARAVALGKGRLDFDSYAVNVRHGARQQTGDLSNVGQRRQSERASAF